MVTCGGYLNDYTDLRCTRTPFHHGRHQHDPEQAIAAVWPVTSEGVRRSQLKALGFIEGMIAGALLMLMILGPAWLAGRL